MNGCIMPFFPFICWTAPKMLFPTFSLLFPFLFYYSCFYLLDSWPAVVGRVSRGIWQAETHQRMFYAALLLSCHAVGACQHYIGVCYYICEIGY